MVESILLNDISSDVFCGNALFSPALSPRPLPMTHWFPK